MKRVAGNARRWMAVVAFAAAMAWVEAAAVYYLRVMVDRIEPYQEDPLPISGNLGEIELVREAATLVMLLAVGTVAARTWHRRLGYTAIAFGVWDILYYAFLRLMSGWPASVFDWDVLFLLPLPWWGPVLAPVCIALLMIVWGTLVTQYRDPSRTTSVTWAWCLSALGIALALYVFMADALRAVGDGLEATRRVLPQRFNWLVFAVALVLIAVPAADAGRRMGRLAGRRTD